MTEKFIVTTLVTWNDGEIKVYIPIYFRDEELAKSFADSQIELAKSLINILQMDVYVDKDIARERVLHLSWRRGRE